MKATANLNLVPAPDAPPVCVHCGTPVPETLRGSRFCCRGCEAVHAFLGGHGLGGYYELRAKGRSVRKAVPAPERSESYAYLDDPGFLELYAREARDGSGDRVMKFYLEGVHCAACVWLTEKLPELVEGVRLARLDLGNSTALVRVAPDGSFARAASVLAGLGYRPHPAARDLASAASRREGRAMLARLGVAATCFGNIMLLTVSLYAGATGRLAAQFRWVSFALFLPVLLYSAQPFLASAWSAVRSRRASIDVPIVFGILLGSGVSVLNLLLGSADVYFDSLAALVFLLLATRVVLRRAQQSALNASKLIRFLTPSAVRRRDEAGGGFVDARLDALRPDDVIRVLAGESIPVDGVVVSGNGGINTALMTGEPAPERASPGSAVLAGTVNQDAPLEIRVTSSGGATRLGRILEEMEQSLSRRAPVVAFADRVSRAFVLVVLAICAGLLLEGILSGNWHSAANRALALSLLACPCAFALATPLAMSAAIARCARNGVLVKGPDAIERLARAHSVFLDKTGTLTEGELSVAAWETGLAGDELRDAEIAIAAIESRSSHPIARAIRRRFEPRPGAELPEVLLFHEAIGQGVSGIVGGRRYELRRARSLAAPEPAARTPIDVLRDGLPIGRLSLDDRLRPDSARAVQALRALGLEPWLITGDHRATAGAVAARVGIQPARVIAGASPEDKRDVVARFPDSVMAGDGANDSVALAASGVGIAVHGGVEVSLRAADIYQGSPGVSGVWRLIVVSRETMRVIRRCFAASIAYNLVGGTAAVLGRVDPLFAAVLMPISAFTVLGISLAGTRRLRRAFEEEIPT